jgi:uncharacterized protein YjiS (DUF1127 family)
MSALTLSTFSDFANSLTVRMTEMPVRTWKSLLRQYTARKALADMMALDDRMLADIGLFRSEISSVVAHRYSDPTRIERRQ